MTEGLGHEETSSPLPDLAAIRVSSPKSFQWTCRIPFLEAALVDVAGRAFEIQSSAVPWGRAAIVRKEAEQQVAIYFKEHNAEYILHVEELTEEWVRRTNATVQSKLGYGLSEATARGEVPEAVVSASLVDYTPQMGAVRDQGNEGSVVGFAIAYAVEYQIFKTTRQRVRLSPREIYNLARTLEGTATTDAGAQIRDGVKVVETEGAILDEIWPRAGNSQRGHPRNLRPQQDTR